MKSQLDLLCRFIQPFGILFTPKEVEIIKSHSKIIHVPAHTILMEQGKTVKKLYFLFDGIVRLFREENHVDYTLGMTSLPFFLSTPIHILNNQISTCSLESLTEVELMEWNKADVLELKKQIPNMYDLELIIMDLLLRWLQDNQINAICMNAEEQYIHLMKTQPRIIQQIPQKYIASLLGIHQDSLSRIRKNIALKN
ncbi:Crp/Fnr family transcriptional regulator [Sphingobacterium sp. HJSM2_6]|uniref:Crp/Fnr family transcriptional regulator n=1 Tax=Sphingobacterium sp. HJSM2_6 TaxID=3366264 RepID=UPI003BDEB545